MKSGKALLDSISFSNTKEGCERLLELFGRLGISKDEVLIGMEATGHYWLSVHAFLQEQGYDVKVINPIQSEAFRKMYIRQTKNDSKDSFIIAQIMRFGQFSATDLSEEVIVAMRQLSRYRLALVDSCGDCKRRVIALLDQVFPEYDSLFSDTFGVTSKEVLSKYPTPEDMLTVSTRKLTNLLEKDGCIKAAAIINKTQVDVYEGAPWSFEAPATEVCVLHTLVVDPRYAGQGIGKRFVAFYEKYALSRRCAVLRIDTNAINAAARALYSRLGYREADIVPCTFNGIPNVNIVLLEKKLK